MIGLQGSGKSFQAKKLVADHLKAVPFSQAAVVSADDYYVDEDGVYRYDPALIGEAHAECFRKFVEYVGRFRADKDLVVVDNTNMCNWERSPYMMLARALGHKTKLVHVRCDPEICARRNTHGVPAETIFDQAKRLETPFPWWDFEVVDTL